MSYLALATDYDGTLATDGQVDAATLDALTRWKQAGRQLILITGRQFDDLLQVFAPIALFDWVVAENGAFLYHPQTQQEKPLAQRPPQEFIDRLRQQILAAEQAESIPEEFSNLVKNKGLDRLGVGRIIVATWTPYDTIAHALIEEMALDLQIILNKGAVMILPTGVDKVLGLRAALAELNLTPEQVVGVGDAENDTAFLTACGYAVAVANALPEVKAQMDFVTTGSRGAGVIELIDRLL
jgi:HAD superfamily hydrolase (TIGR01484 family)